MLRGSTKAAALHGVGVRPICARERVRPFVHDLCHRTAHRARRARGRPSLRALHIPGLCCVHNGLKVATPRLQLGRAGLRVYMLVIHKNVRNHTRVTAPVSARTAAVSNERLRALVSSRLETQTRASRQRIRSPGRGARVNSIRAIVGGLESSALPQARLFLAIFFQPAASAHVIPGYEWDIPLFELI